MRKGTIFLFVWLIIGAAAAGQRGYFGAPNLGCTQGATMALTIAAGPLNYVGLDPKISCTTPRPSGASPLFTGRTHHVPFRTIYSERTVALRSGPRPAARGIPAPA